MSITKLLVFVSLFFCSITFAESTNKLKKLEKFLEGDYSVLSNKLLKRIDEIDELQATQMKYIKKIQSAQKSLKTVSKTLGTMDITLRAASLIPPIKVPAAVTGKAVTVFKKSFDIGKKEADKLIPITKKYTTFDKQAKKILKLWKKELEITTKTAGKLSDISKDIRKCLSKVDERNKTASSCYDNIVLSPLKGTLNTYNELYEINKKEEKYLNFLDEKISALNKKLKIIETLEKELKKLLKKLKSFIKGVGKLKKFYNGKMKFSFKVPMPKVSNPNYKHKIKIRFSVKKILKGLKKLEIKLGKIISKEIMKVALKLGVKKELKKLIKRAKREIKKLVNSIPVIKKLKLGSLKKLNNINLNMFFKEIEGLFNTLKVDLDMALNINKKFPDFNVKMCPIIEKKCVVDKK